MSAEGAGVTLLVMAGVGWFATFVAEIVILAYVGVILFSIALAILLIMGVVAYGIAATEAIQEEDYAWQANIVLAPILASLSIFVLHGFYHAWWRFLINSGNRLGHWSLLGALLSLGLGLCMLASIIIAPAIGVLGMTTSNRAGHVVAYIGFFYTASYWGMSIASWAGYKWGLSWNN